MYPNQMLVNDYNIASMIKKLSHFESVIQSPGTIRISTVLLARKMMIMGISDH